MSGILAALAGIKTAIATAVDEYFNRTTLLLNTSSTNGAQNNTFLDSSTNNFTITRNGNTTQGTFTPFSQTGWSNYFSSNYISASATLISTTATTFTMEGWIYMTATPVSGGNVPGLCGDMLGSATTNYMSFGPLANGTLGFQWFNGSTNVTAAGNTVMSLNTWYHVAISVNSSAIKMFVNGVDQTITGTSTLTNRGGTSSTFTVGYNSTQASITGYVSNLRVTNTAVYTGTFTPSTAPLTAISGTLFLTAQSNRFIDNSTNNYAITATSSPSVQAFSPFAPTAAYDTAVVGGSGYFDGTGDYLTVPDTTSLEPGTGDFCFETWVYHTSASNGSTFDSYVHQSSGGLFVYRNLSNKIQVDSDGVVAILTSASNVPFNSWAHIAVTRSGTTLRIFINGVVDASVTNSTNIAGTGVISYGGRSDGSILDGYLSSTRFVKGSPVYTTTFTPPTAPLTAITNTSILLNYTNGGIYDSTAKNVLETVGNAQVSTTQAKWGTTSMYFDGTGDALKAPYTPNMDFGTGDFTIECWVYVTNTSPGYSQTVLARHGSSGGTIWIVQILDGGTSRINLAGSVNCAGTTVAANTWTHLAFTRSGTSLRAFNNGVLITTVTDSTSLSGTQILTVGAQSDIAAPLIGYLDDVRITKGYARYTATFTPPAAAFPLQ